MTNEIVRAITVDGLVKAAAITGRDIVERARNIHKLLPTATAALGRTLMGASLMGDMLKEEKGTLTLQIKGGGPLGTILAVSDHQGNVRGYVQNPQVELMEQRPGKLDVGRAVGTDGTLTVIKDIGQASSAASGLSAAQTGTRCSPMMPCPACSGQSGRPLWYRRNNCRTAPGFLKKSKTGAAARPFPGTAERLVQGNKLELAF